MTVLGVSRVGCGHIGFGFGWS